MCAYGIAIIAYSVHAHIKLNKAVRVLLWAPGIAAFIIPYIRFDSWPCPRCGFAFSDLKRKMPVRSERCHFCGLRRNEVPEEAGHSGWPSSKAFK
jgi:hypothetical protein